MERRLKLFKRILGYLDNPNQESLDMSMNHTHSEGLFSLVLNGTEPGKLTRIFIADKKLKPFGIQLHTHRYPIRLTTFKGNVTHHIAVECDTVSGGVELSEYEYQSFLNGGNGLTYIREAYMRCSDYKLPIASTSELSNEDYHTVSCSKGSMWIVEELGLVTAASKVLGVPFAADGLYHESDMFQINDKCQVVRKEIKRIIEAYSQIELN